MVDLIPGKVRRLGRRMALGALKRVKQYDPRDNLLLFCDPRGGSTWLAQLVAHVPRTAILWEPLVIDQVEEFKQLDFSWRQHIPEGAEWPAAKDAFDRVLSGGVLNAWTARASRRGDFLAAEKLVVKFCRANAMIPWLTRSYSFRYVPVHLLRHPFSVVASQLRHGGWIKKPEGSVISSHGPFPDPRARHRDFLRTLESREEQLCATWFLANEIPLTDPRGGRDWTTVYYEDLLTDPRGQIEAIFHRWGLPVPDAIWHDVRVPSSTTKDTTFLESTQEQLTKWRRELSAEQLARMREVWSYFVEASDMALPYEIS
jgi:hypothetical protein